MTKQKTRNVQIDVLRGIAVALMILGHSFIVYPIDISHVPWCAAVQHFIYTFHMELLFLISGYCYHCECYLPYIKKKILRILVPYTFFGVVAVLLRAFGGSAINGVEPIGKSVISLFLNGGGYWFLYALFLIFALYPFAEKILNTPEKKMIVAIILVAIYDWIPIPPWFQLSSILYQLPYFILGDVIRKTKLTDLKRKASRFGSLAIAIFGYWGADWLFSSKNIYLTVLRDIRALCVILVLWLIVESRVMKKARHTIAFAKKILCDLSKYSLQMYLLNGYFLVILRILLCNILQVQEPIIIVLAIWLGDIFGTLILCNWVIPHLPFFRVICGIDNRKIIVK